MNNTFNKNSASYSEVRPSYPDSIFQNFHTFYQADEFSTFLEIGSGTGIATEIVANRWGANIIAIEPGQSLFNLGCDNLNSFKNIALKNTTFEQFDTSTKFDCIYAATAFHWLEPELKFSKSHTLLKEGGLLFVFWNYYALKNDETNEAIQLIYKEHHPREFKEVNVKNLRKNKIIARREEIENSCYFKHIDHFEVTYYKSFNSEQYIKLLKTFPDNAFSEVEIAPFFKAIETYIKRNNDEIELEILVCSEIAEKIS